MTDEGAYSHIFKLVFCLLQALEAPPPPGLLGILPRTASHPGRSQGSRYLLALDHLAPPDCMVRELQLGKSIMSQAVSGTLCVPYSFGCTYVLASCHLDTRDHPFCRYAGKMPARPSLLSLARWRGHRRGEPRDKL